MVKENLYIGGAFERAASGETIQVVDPATEDEVARVARGRREDVERAAAAAEGALAGEWGRITPGERGRLLRAVYERMAARRGELERVESLDVGKPRARAADDVAGALRYLEYYAGVADKLQGETIPLGPERLAFTLLEPLGVTAHIVPWNFPINLAMRSVAPALAAGNAAIVKPAEETPLSALLFAEICDEAGLPAGVINVVTGYGDEAGAALVTHERVAGVTFTGSVETGKGVMRAAADNVVPVALELGGKSPQIIFADADLDRAVEDTITSIFTTNAGQICSAASRLLLHRDVRDEYLDRLRARAGALRVGPPAEEPDMGPLVSGEHRDRVVEHIRGAAGEGARLVAGGGRPRGLERGFFVEPSIFDGVRPEMRIAREEVFGPVLAVMDFDDEGGAAELANATPYGLVAGIYTRDIERAMTLARSIQAGQVWINQWDTAGEETPFGGYKQSGIGREKGLGALASYVQTKAVVLGS